MTIRPFEPGDEAAQARIYNASAAELPGFKPASGEEIARRRAGDTSGVVTLLAVEGGEAVGYASANPNGRISVPWCVPGAEPARDPLLDALLAEMAARGQAEAWAAYREDWRPVQEYLAGRGFEVRRTMVNFVAPLDLLPCGSTPEGLSVAPAEPDDWAGVHALAPHRFDFEPEILGAYYAAHPMIAASSTFAARDRSGQTLGLAVAVADPRFADPTAVDPAMPCFRLGTLGTEAERHKRINGLFSAVFERPEAGEALLCEAARRFAAAGLTHLAAQVPSDDAPALELFDRHLQRQGEFPIRARAIDPS